MPRWPDPAQKVLALRKQREKLGISGPAEVKIPLPKPGPAKMPKLTPEQLEKLTR